MQEGEVVTPLVVAKATGAKEVLKPSHRSHGLFGMGSEGGNHDLF